MTSIYDVVVCLAASRGGEHGLRGLGRMAELKRGGRSTAWIGSRMTAHGPLRLLAAYVLPGSGSRAPGETALMQAVQTWDVTSRLGEISAPVLVVGGTRDRLIPPELVRATASGIPDARLVLLAGRGHATALFDQLTKPAIAAFLAEAGR